MTIEERGMLFEMLLEFGEYNLYALLSYVINGCAHEFSCWDVGVSLESFLSFICSRTSKI